MSYKDKTDEELLEQLRENGKKEGTLESFLYGVLSTADPRILKSIEEQAVQFQKIGAQIGRQIVEDGNDPSKKADWFAMFDRIASNVSQKEPLVKEEDTE